VKCKKMRHIKLSSEFNLIGNRKLLRKSLRSRSSGKLKNFIKDILKRMDNPLKKTVMTSFLVMDDRNLSFKSLNSKKIIFLHKYDFFKNYLIGQRFSTITN